MPTNNKRGFRYTSAIVVLSSAALVGAGALALLLGSQASYQHAQGFDKQRSDAAKTISQLYQQSYHLSIGSLVAGISAGALAGLGGGMGLYQVLNKKQNGAMGTLVPKVPSPTNAFTLK